MKKSIFTFFILYFSIHLAAGAQSGELSATLDELKSTIQEVTTSKNTYKQEVATPAPALLSITITETDSKGRSDSKEYVMNLADIDPYTVKSETTKDIINVMFSITNKQKLIGVTDNGEKDNFQNELKLYATDIDNARKLVDLIKNAIPLAKTLVDNRLALNSYEEQLNWLMTNIIDVSKDDDVVKQTLVKGNYPGSVVLNQTIVGSKGSEENSYTFNLSEIDPVTVNINVSGDDLSIESETVRDRKIIQHQQQGELKPYDDELEILAESVEKARDIRTVLLKAVENAKAVVDKEKVNYSNSEQALAGVKKYLKEVQVGDAKMIQTLTGDCKATFKQEEIDDSGTEKIAFSFNFMDINPEAIQFDVSGSKMTIEAITMNKIKLIKELEAEVLKGYTDDFTIYTAGFEEARRLQLALKATVENCLSAYKEPFTAGSELSYVLSAIGEVGKEGLTIEQKLEEVEPGKLKFTKTTVNEKGGTEEIFEFNIKDLNEKTVEFEISGDDLELVVSSNFEEKVIKYYKNGEIGNYENELVFSFNDIEKARGVKRALIGLIKSVKK